jgi:hypothetical protein
MDSFPESSKCKTENPRILEQDLNTAHQLIKNEIKNDCNFTVFSSNCMGKFSLQFEEDIFWLFAFLSG